ncbi:MULTISPECIES: hypothetical protein [unclassified Marinimicrobium]|jgi:hypothetical protein|uniref:hypothetical protein n=1 Tax=Marinimicrobium TaxID=359337 RepID=UPI000C3E0B75|nr:MULTISPECIES: hypothetical protein [unclassified Marinimicrobium]MAN50328.1 hypothetical protein [Marinimicrobium sp.]|tara:strand:- start:240 stop:596 length:357 start_codon:yes stop_codon:yes gene_type:complete
MNTDYQLVATGTLTPLSRDVLDGASQSELSSSQSKRADWVKRIQPSMVEVAVTSGKPVYAQRWYQEKDHAALFGYPVRLGEESFSDIIIATWHAGTFDVEAWRKRWACGGAHLQHEKT